MTYTGYKDSVLVSSSWVQNLWVIQHECKQHAVQTSSTKTACQTVCPPLLCATARGGMQETLVPRILGEVRIEVVVLSALATGLSVWISSGWDCECAGILWLGVS